MTLLLAASFGIAQVFSTIKINSRLDIVYADVVVKGMMIAAFKNNKDYQTSKINRSCLEIPIYNAAKIQNVLTKSFELIRVLKDFPPDKSIMYCSALFTSCPFLSWMVRIVESFIPALIIDGILRINGMKPK